MRLVPRSLADTLFGIAMRLALSFSLAVIGYHVVRWGMQNASEATIGVAGFLAAENVVKSILTVARQEFEKRAKACDEDDDTEDDDDDDDDGGIVDRYRLGQPA